MTAIELQTLRATAGTVRYEFTYPDRLRRFFSGEDLVLEYDTPVAAAPDGLLAVPWVANVCPIAWATGTDVHVPRLDARFAGAIPRVAAAFADLYPDLVGETTIHVDATTDDPGPHAPADRSPAMLFSGGVDSVATYCRHREESPLLVSVHGHDVAVDDEEGWAARRAAIEGFATDRGLATRYVRANARAFQEPFMLYAHFGDALHSDWIDSVHLGLGLASLVAPLAGVAGIDPLYVADSVSRLHVAAGTDEVANHPSIVDSIAWSGTSVSHDGFPLTRQEKVDLIADTDEAPLALHVCLEDDTENCTRCEKCLRTAVALVLAGEDPDEYGFDVDAEAFRHAREQFETGAWTLDGGRLPHWRDLQESARDRREALALDRPGARDFVDWLAATDVDRFAERDVKLPRELLRATARHTPYPVYTRARNADRVVSLATRLLDR